MAQREKGGRVVFIGNIPYTVTEEEICHLFSSAGVVVNFRLVYDKETGKPKGFGFLEFTDPDAAATAVRNLNDTSLHGRTLRVDYSNDNGGGKGNQQDRGGDASARAPPPAHFNQDNAPQAAGDSALPPLPPGQELAPGMSAPDAISKTISAFPAPALVDALSQMKSMAMQNSDMALTLFQSSPQLGYAVFQALLLLGVVDTSILASLVQGGGVAPPQQQPPPQQPPPIQYAQHPVQPPYGQPPMPAGYPPAYAPQVQPPYAPTPPVQQPAYQPPPVQQAQPMPVDPNQAAQIKQILSIPQDVMLTLPAGQREQIMQIRAMYGG